MKILFVTETWAPSVDGIVTRLTNTFRVLRSFGHEIVVVAPRQSRRAARSHAEGVTEWLVPGIPLMYGRRRFGLPTPAIGEAIRRHRPDIVHVVSPFLLGIAGVRYARRWGIRLVASYHTNIAEYAGYYGFGFAKPAIWWILKRLHNEADLNLATSRSALSLLEQSGVRRLVLWERGVDTERFHPDKSSPGLRERLTGGRPERKLALYVGRLAPEKNLRSLRSLLQRTPGLHLALVGDGPDRRSLEAWFRDTPATFTGSLDGEELAAAYASADVFVFPSVTETLGLVLLEALASGLPLVAAQSPPTEELFRQSPHIGHMYRGEDEASMQNAVRDILSRDRDCLRDTARNLALRYNWESSVRRLLINYEQVLAGEAAETGVEPLDVGLEKSEYLQTIRKFFARRSD